MSLFGEIVEPSSRVAWEDWDDMTDVQSQDLNWEHQVDSPKKIDTLIILEDKLLSDCVKIQNHLDLEVVNSIPQVHLVIYKEKNTNIHICTIQNYNLVQSSEITELLKVYVLVSLNVVAIQTKPLPDYQTITLSNQDCIIRKICTTSNIKSVELNYPNLEQPNIISGVTAGVISLREHLDMPGTAIVCYTEPAIELPIVMQELLKKFNIFNTKSRPSNVLNSNLYI